MRRSRTQKLAELRPSALDCLLSPRGCIFPSNRRQGRGEPRRPPGLGPGEINIHASIQRAIELLLFPQARLRFCGAGADVTACGGSLPGFSRKVPCPMICRLEDLQAVDGYFPFEPQSQLPRLGPAGRAGAAADSGGHGIVAHAHGDARSGGRARADRSRRLHGRESLFPKFSRSLRHRQSLSAQRQNGPASWRALSARTLAGGRFIDCGPEEIRKQIMRGEERFEAGGRSPLQARCVQLARMGAVVFHYDMLGYADSMQISLELAHRFREKCRAPHRPHMNTPDHWGLFSPQAELRMQKRDGHSDLQFGPCDRLAQSIARRRSGADRRYRGQRRRHADDVLHRRSILGRVVGFPAVMVSTGMQGDCTCDNCCLLRVGTGNVEFAAMMAPRALGMTGADDWTRDIMTKGFPQLKQHYEMLGAGDKVMARALVQFQHNYNYVSREVMYQWFNKHLQMGLPEPVIEEDYRPLSIAEMSVWDADHPRPSGGEDYERQLLAWMTGRLRGQIAALTPHDSQSWIKYREVVGGAIDAIVGRELPKAGSIESVQHGSRDAGAWQEISGAAPLSGRGGGIAGHYPASQIVEPPDRHLAHRAGEGGPIWRRRSIGRRSPQTVGRRDRDRCPRLALSGRVSGRRQAAGRSAASQRTRVNLSASRWDTTGHCAPSEPHDVLSVVSWLRYGEPLRSDVVALLALKGTAPWAAAALAQARGSRRPRGNRHGRLPIRELEIAVGRESVAGHRQVRRSARPVEPGRADQALAGRRRE